MGTLNIAVVVGSLRKESYNRQLAHALVRLFPDDLRAHFVRIDDLPLYDQDSDIVSPAPPVARFRAEIAAADGVLFVTPEYNRSIPGVLKNAIDQASRPWGESKWAGSGRRCLDRRDRHGGCAGTPAQRALRGECCFDL